MQVYGQAKTFEGKFFKCTEFVWLHQSKSNGVFTQSSSNNCWQESQSTFPPPLPPPPQTLTSSNSKRRVICLIPSGAWGAHAGFGVGFTLKGKTPQNPSDEWYMTRRATATITQSGWRLTTPSARDEALIVVRGEWLSLEKFIGWCYKCGHVTMGQMTLTARGITPSDAAKASTLYTPQKWPICRARWRRGTGLKKRKVVTAALLAALFAFNLTH